MIKKVILMLQVVATLLVAIGQSAIAQSNWKISSIEAGASLSSATAGNGFGGNLFGLDLNMRMRLHYAKLPDGLDFSIGLHERRSHWEVSPMYVSANSYYGIAPGTMLLQFHPANHVFKKDEVERFLISLGMSYTKRLGKNWGWTSDAYFIFSPLPKSKVTYDVYSKNADGDWEFQSHNVAKAKNGFSPGVGLKSGIWWKLPIKSKHDFRLGLNLGYEYQNMLQSVRNFKLEDGVKPMSILSKRLNSAGHIGMSFAIGLN